MTKEILTDEEYFNKPCVSQSFIKAFKTSPENAWKSCPLNPNYEEWKGSEATILGNLYHTIFSEPEKLNDEFLVVEDSDPRWTTQTRGVKYWAWQEDEDKKIVRQSEVLKAYAVINHAKDHRFSERILNGCNTEEPLFWMDKKTGLPCKGKVDLIKMNENNEVIVIDLKTTSNWKETPYLKDEGWHIQGDMYRRAAEARFGANNIRGFKFIIFYIYIGKNERDIGKFKFFEIAESTLELAEVEVDLYMEEIAEGLLRMKNGADPKKLFRYNYQIVPEQLHGSHRDNGYWEAFANEKGDRPELTRGIFEKEKWRT